MTEQINPAPCLGSTHLFFPAILPNGQEDAPDPQALALCRSCPVAIFNDCLTAGYYEPYGVYAGTTPADRRQMRKSSKTPEPFYKQETVDHADV